MKINQQQLNQAVKQHIISAQQADELYSFLSAQQAHIAQFTFTHVLYYFGGLIAIGAMSLFMTLGWSTFGGAGILAISLAYAAIGLWLTHRFANKQLIIPAGICATFVTCLTPLAVFGLQQWLGFWPSDTNYRDYHSYIHWHWLYMELATLAVGTMIAWRYRYPFLVMPIAVTLWYLTMDLSVMIVGGNSYDASWELRKMVSMYTGLLMLGLAFWIDMRTRATSPLSQQDYAFWIYLFGVIAFWGGLSLQNSDSELAKFGYFIINLVMIGLGVLLVRRVFVVFGAFGSCIYLGHLAHSVFEDSWLFPIVLSVIGLLVIYLGVLWQKHEQAISQGAQSILPKALQQLLASKR
ncbi:DUF2157 domain-containing protein [Thalassotalea euphylliae]|uniref:DUF2157 domain-containing protein n=1 Tax=Thalassotalea euphylliae TaxID=1655234 RepID=A0A3E0TX82_9GAMM|nr:DUF2157 domain-containing protein [Thalassotalea euphylliae]REL28977.1 DUF2157 domain-containing protein [Thalassotalea euphylliae]